MLMTDSTTATEAAKVEAIQQASTSNQKAEPAVAEADDEMNEEDETIVDAPPPEILSGLESLQHYLELLRPKLDKFMTRLCEVRYYYSILIFCLFIDSPIHICPQRDPITKKPRYGEKAIVRVKKIITMYKALEIGVSIAFANNCIVSSLKEQIKRHDDQIKAKEQSILMTQQLEAERKEKERLAAEQAAKDQRLKEEKAKRKETEELAARAAEARMRRLQEEQAAVDAEAEADRELLASVPVKGVEGVRMQIDRMRDALKDDKKALDVALGSFYTLFDQIVRKPEEVNYRRIRREHPKFMEDIGRHVGGREVLIAAGFKLEKLDGVACFFSKEPHIESDMDGWSDWFDGLKKTLEVIEEEMIK
jgi:hypothetical protein